MSRREGYVVDVPYPLHFYKEMQPTWLACVVRTLGCVTPDLTRPYRYCELGCGAGINTLVAAACNPLGQFVGVDFNPRHIAMARAAAQQAGIGNVEFIEASFETFAGQGGGQFDFIVSHGVWSWLPPLAQRAIMRIIHDRLAPQGLFYLQYMCYPGAARLIGLQKLLYEVSLAGDSGSAQSVRQGLALLRKLADGGAGLFVDNPEIKEELAALEKTQPDYLAHDFLTDHWQPQHSADVHRIIAQAGTPYLGSANPFENMDALSIPGHVQPLLTDAPTRSLKETIRDAARNQNQRMDIFQKQPRTLEAQAHLAALDGIVFKALENMPPAGALEFKTPIGVIPGPEEIFAPLIGSLRAGDQAFSALRRLPLFAPEPGLLLQALNMLIWAEYAHPLRQDVQPAVAAAGLQAWVAKQRLPLRILPDCGSAIQSQTP